MPQDVKAADYPAGFPGDRRDRARMAAAELERPDDASRIELGTPPTTTV